MNRVTTTLATGGAQVKRLARWSAGAVGAVLQAMKTRSTRMPRMSPPDEVLIDVRRHWTILGLPFLRTASGLLVMLAGVRPLLFPVVFAAATLMWGRRRLNLELRPAAILAGGATAALLLLASRHTLGSGVLLLLALLLWFLDDLGDWWTDRLVVTNKRLYRLYGLFTSHSPSISLTAVAFIDPLVSPLGRVLGYGTILLDTHAQRDAPLSHFDHLPDVEKLHVHILELRSAAMPKFPTIPGM